MSLSLSQVTIVKGSTTIVGYFLEEKKWMVFVHKGTTSERYIVTNEEVDALLSEPGVEIRKSVPMASVR
jgi:hypothetical protein